MSDYLDDRRSSVTVHVTAVEPIPVPGGMPRNSIVHFRLFSDKFGSHDLHIEVPNVNHLGSAEDYARERLYQFGRDLAEQADPALFVKRLG